MIHAMTAASPWYTGRMVDTTWLTTSEAAELSGYSVQYVRRLIRTGRVKARKFGPVWQIDKQALMAYVEAGERSDDKRRGPTTN